jgi:hypothetical protein
MRILGMLLLGAGLLMPGLGCSLQHTAGPCDCDPPPVGSLLIAPSPAHPSLGVYGSMVHTPLGVDQGNPPRVEPLSIMPKVVTPMP